MNLDDVRTIVQAVESRTQTQPLLLPGTVGSVGGGGLVEVVMDSDPDGSSIEASCLFADVGEGDRVMVLFDPPRGVYAVGLIGRTVEAGQLVFREREIVGGGGSPVPYAAGTTTVVSEDVRVSLRADRCYDFRMSVNCELDTVGTDGVTVTASLALPSAPSLWPESGGNTITGVWGTPNGALVGGAEGTIHFARIFLLPSAWSGDVEIRVDVFALTAGDIEVSWEATITDAGPVSAVV